MSNVDYIMDIYGDGSKQLNEMNLDEILATLPAGSLDFVKANFSQDGNTLTISSLTDDEKLDTSIESSNPTTNELNNSVATDFPSVLQEISSNETSHMKRQNELFKNQNDLLRENNKIQTDMVNELKQQNKALTGIVQNMVVQNSLNSQHYQAVESHLMAQTMVNGLLYQKEDFNINGDDSVKNSNDEKIVPMHEKAKKDSEKAIETHNMNKTDFSMIANVFDGDGSDSVGDLDHQDNLFNVLGDLFKLPEDFEIPENMQEGDLGKRLIVPETDSVNNNNESEV